MRVPIPQARASCGEQLPLSPSNDHDAKRNSLPEQAEPNGAPNGGGRHIPLPRYGEQGIKSRRKIAQGGRDGARGVAVGQERADDVQRSVGKEQCRDRQTEDRRGTRIRDERRENQRKKRSVDDNGTGHARRAARENLAQPWEKTAGVRILLHRMQCRRDGHCPEWCRRYRHFLLPFGEESISFLKKRDKKLLLF